MSRFVVLFASKTFVKMSKYDNCKVDIGDTEVFFRVMSDPRDFSLSGLDYGWIIDVRLTEDDIDEAILKANGVVEFFLSILCLEIGHPVPASKILLAYDISEDIKKQIFRQYLDINPIVNGAEVDLTSFTDHGNQINEINDLRLFRAVRSFRKGFNASDPLDQFLSFWNGLESLNPLLAEHYGEKRNVKLKTIGRICEHCGKGCQTFVPAGIETLYDDLKIDEKIKKKITDTRIGLVHGTKTITELNENALELLPKIALILHKGISKVTGITFEGVLYQNLMRIHPIKIGDILYVQGFMIIVDSTKITTDHYIHINKDENGNLKVLPEGYALEDREYHSIVSADVKVDISEKVIK